MGRGGERGRDKGKKGERKVGRKEERKKESHFPLNTEYYLILYIHN